MIRDLQLQLLNLFDINICMANVEETYTNIPESAEISYKPLGGEVETVVSLGNRLEIEAIASFRAQTAIEAGYGDTGDGKVLDHLRRRNLGLI